MRVFTGGRLSRTSAEFFAEGHVVVTADYTRAGINYTRGES